MKATLLLKKLGTRTVAVVCLTVLVIGGGFVILAIGVSRLNATNKEIFLRGTEDVQDRTRPVLTSLPRFADDAMRYGTLQTGDCHEITKNTHLITVQDAYTLDSTTFKEKQSEFIATTKAQGIEWYDGNTISKPFMRDGYTYKLNIVSPPKRVLVQLTACDRPTVWLDNL